MAWKFGLLFGLLSIVSAIEVHHHHAAIIKTAPVHVVKHVEYEDAPPEYEFSYSVHDDHTGDIKSQKESRKGDKVEGSYELIDSDGHRRSVHYTADDHNGFQAVVHREPTDIKIPIPEHKEIVHHHKILATPIVHYAPVHKIVAAPIHHHHTVVAAAPAKIVHTSHPVNNHVSFSGPHHSYNY